MEKTSVKGLPFTLIKRNHIIEKRDLNGINDSYALSE